MELSAPSSGAIPSLPVGRGIYPHFLDLLTARGRSLPGYVQREFDDYLKCGRLEHGFLRVRCDTCHAEREHPFSHVVPRWGVRHWGGRSGFSSCPAAYPEELGAPRPDHRSTGRDLPRAPGAVGAGYGEHLLGT